MPAAVVKDGTVTPKFRQGKISPPFLTAKFTPGEIPPPCTSQKFQNPRGQWGPWIPQWDPAGSGINKKKCADHHGKGNQALHRAKSEIIQ